MSAPIVIHRLSPTGGRRVTIRGQVAGLAYDDQDVVEFLRRAGLPDAQELLDQPEWVQWRGGRAHTYAGGVGAREWPLAGTGARVGLGQRRLRSGTIRAREHFC